MVRALSFPTLVAFGREHHIRRRRTVWAEPILLFPQDIPYIYICKYVFVVGVGVVVVVVVVDSHVVLCSLH